MSVNAEITGKFRSQILARVGKPDDGAAKVTIWEEAPSSGGCPTCGPDSGSFTIYVDMEQVFDATYEDQRFMALLAWLETPHAEAL